jgi:hypothetical protein
MDRLVHHPDQPIGHRPSQGPCPTDPHAHPTDPSARPCGTEPRAPHVDSRTCVDPAPPGPSPTPIEPTRPRPSRPTPARPRPYTTQSFSQFSQPF